MLSDERMLLRVTLVTAVLACSEPRQTFVVPKNPEDVRGRLLTLVEGHTIDDARALFQRHGIPCDAPLPSATDARAHVCHPPDRAWHLVLYERNGRVQDVQGSY